MGRFAQGKFQPKNPDKYVGRRSPTYRSSWEFAFMKFCDENPAIQSWASEAVKIPYRNPLTGRHTIYVPDFFIQYKTKKGNKMNMTEGEKQISFLNKCFIFKKVNNMVKSYVMAEADERDETVNDNKYSISVGYPTKTNRTVILEQL